MSIKISTGLRQNVAKHLGWKKALEDMVLNIYSGTAPAAADDAATGTLLCTLTLASGALTPGTKSTRQKDYFAVTGAGSEGDTLTVTITPTSGIAEVYAYTIPATPTATIVANGVAALIDASEYVTAIGVTDTTEKAVAIRARYAGEGFATLTAKTGGVTLSTVGAITPTTANARANGLHFEMPSSVAAGVLDKETGVWSGTVLANGTSAWFRVQNSNDAGASSTTLPRLQGNISTSNSDINIPSLIFTTGATYTQDTFSITVPAS